nr:unnamed protein product [Callosobruchus analis]
MVNCSAYGCKDESVCWCDRSHFCRALLETNTKRPYRGVLANVRAHMKIDLAKLSLRTWTSSRCLDKVLMSAEMSKVIKYKKRKTWDRANMISAVAAVQTKKMGYLKASKIFSVPRATLFRFVKEKNESIAEVVDKPIGRKPVLDRDIESQLVD